RHVRGRGGLLVQEEVGRVGVLVGGPDERLGLPHWRRVGVFAGRVLSGGVLAGGVRGGALRRVHGRRRRGGLLLGGSVRSSLGRTLLHRGLLAQSHFLGRYNSRLAGRGGKSK